MPSPDLLLAIWREACRHLELEESIERIADMVATHVLADHLLIRQVDLTRSGLDTIAAAACGDGRVPVSSTRTDANSSSMRELLAWTRSATVIGGAFPARDPLLSIVAPPAYAGHCIAAPLHADDGPVGAVLLLSSQRPFDARDRVLLSRIAEPIAVALGNTARVHELKRLREALEADKQALLTKLGRHDVADAVVGAETGLRVAMQQVEQVAATDVPVLIFGETGSGKEVLARALHERSRRARAPIVRVNCGAIPPGLVDSELFGHERGSFTGAVATRLGWFERANGGTLFLDEIGELPLEAQVRLLRILQDGTFERVGGQRPLSADVRIVAATHRDLQEMVARGTFREDLWYRISVFPIQLPPLRERREDIPRLASQFAARAATRLVGHPLTPTTEDLELLLAYDWPGNVRELAAVIERAAILGAGRVLRVAAALGPATPPSPADRPASAPAPHPFPASPSTPETPATSETWNGAMRDHIERALRTCRGRIEGRNGAAGLLQINPHTLRARMRQLGIPWKTFRTQGPRVDGGPFTPLALAMTTHVTRVLQDTHGRVEGVNGAAARLGVNPHTLRARIRKLGVSASNYRQPASGAPQRGES